MTTVRAEFKMGAIYGCWLYKEGCRIAVIKCKNSFSFSTNEVVFLMKITFFLNLNLNDNGTQFPHTTTVQSPQSALTAIHPLTSSVSRIKHSLTKPWKYPNLQCDIYTANFYVASDWVLSGLALIYALGFYFVAHRFLIDDAWCMWWCRNA